MDELRFEEDYAELRSFLHEAHNCKKNTALLTRAVREVVRQLKASSDSLNAVMRMSAQHAPGRAPTTAALPNIKDSDFVDLIDTVDRLVAKQLEALAGVASTVYVQAKKRRESREKYLKSTATRPIGGRQSPSKIAKRKDDFVVSDQRYEELYQDYRSYTAPHVARVREDFHTGYYTVLSALAQTLQPGTSDQEPVEVSTAPPAAAAAPRGRPAATTGITSFESRPPLRRNNGAANGNGGGGPPNEEGGGDPPARTSDVMSNAYDDFIYGTYASGYDREDEAAAAAAGPSGQRRVSGALVAPGIPMVSTELENPKTVSASPAYPLAVECPKPPPQNRVAVTAGVMRQSQEMRRMEAAAIDAGRGGSNSVNANSTNVPHQSSMPRPSSANTEDHFIQVQAPDDTHSNASEQNPFSFMWSEN